MNFFDELENLIRALEANGTDYALCGGVALAEKVWADRQVVPFQGGNVRVVSREGLIALKLAAGRPQDVADVKRLEELSRG